MDREDQTKKRSPWLAIIAVLAVVALVATVALVWNRSERLDGAEVVVCDVLFFFCHVRVVT